MDVYRISNAKYSDHLNGEGAFRVGGRWNSKGVRMLYTSSSRSLAALEVLVHTDELLAPPSLILITIEIPDELIVLPTDLPESWRVMPHSSDSKLWGDQFINSNKKLATYVPSVIIPEEQNILINPLHLAFSQVKISHKQRFSFDGRLK